MPIDNLDWEYEPGDRPWTPTSCFTLLLIIAVFWLAVIGGGLWLANNL